MKYFVIADNNDTHIGMRLAGIEGVVCRTPEEARAAIDRAAADPDIGILLITEQLAAQCEDKLTPMKMNLRTPLVVEIPDRNSKGRTSDSITRYIQDAIGVKL